MIEFEICFIICLQHDIEIEVVDKLSSLLKLFTHPSEEDDNKSLNRTNELIMVNNSVRLLETVILTTVI